MIGISNISSLYMMRKCIFWTIPYPNIKGSLALMAPIVDGFFYGCSQNSDKNKLHFQNSEFHVYAIELV